MAAIHDVLTCFNAYLTNSDASTVRDSLSYYNKKLLAFRHDFHTVTIDDPIVQDNIQSILDGLPVSPLRKNALSMPH